LELDRERTEFFDTRVDGRPEVWQAIKAVLEVLWSGGDPDDNDGGLLTAQGILDAAGITLPSGVMVGGVYDSFGFRYVIPEYIVSDPVNLRVTRPAEPTGNLDKGEGSGEESPEELLNEEDRLRRREEKG